MKLNNITGFIISEFWERESFLLGYCHAFVLSENVLHTTFKKAGSLSIYNDGDIYLQMIDDIFVVGLPQLRINGNIVSESVFRDPDVQCFKSFPQLIPVYRHFCDTVL